MAQALNPEAAAPTTAFGCGDRPESQYRIFRSIPSLKEIAFHFCAVERKPLRFSCLWPWRTETFHNLVLKLTERF